MSNYYDENRKNEIMKALSVEKLLTEKELYKSEELSALKSFSDALLQNIILPEQYSTGKSPEANNLAAYIRGLAGMLELKDDEDILYTAEQIACLYKKIYLLDKGVKGEKLAHRAMFGIKGPNRILTNLEFYMDEMPFETDAIVINENGISIVEVKSIRCDLNIDKNGRLVAVDGSGRTYCNFRMKLNNSVAVVRRILEESFSDNEKIQSLAKQIHVVLLSTDGVINDCRQELTIADCDNITQLINDIHHEVTLDSEEINAIAKALEDASQLNRYPLKYDYHRFAESFAIAEAKLEYYAQFDPLDIFFKKLGVTGCDCPEEMDDEPIEVIHKRIFPRWVYRHKNIIRDAACIAVIGVGAWLYLK